MRSTSLQYKLIKKIKDERFDEDLIHRYHLLVNIGTRDFQLLIVDPTEDVVLLLEDFVLPNLTSHQELMNLLDQLFDSHALLKVGFWKKIIIAVKNQKFVQVPQALFAYEALHEYLKFNASVHPEKEDFFYTNNILADAVTIFAVNADMVAWLNGIYPNNPPTLTHQSAALIEGMMQYAQLRDDNPLYIYVDRFKLHILSCRDGRLIYYNQFAIKQFSDYVKYIMLVMKSLHMDQATSQVVLWGYIGKNSPHYHEFYKYINNVTFGVRPADLKFSYMFDEVQEHHFFDLFSLHYVS